MNVTPAFVLAGEATFTVSNGAGQHYTYHVYGVEPSVQYLDPAWFIKVKVGPEEDDWAYVGKVIVRGEADPVIKLTARSRWKDGDIRVVVAYWALRVIWQVDRGDYTLPPYMSIKHEGRCGRCGRPLTHPASLDTGIGPDCAAEMGIEWKEKGAGAPEGEEPSREAARLRGGQPSLLPAMDAEPSTEAKP